MSNFKLCDKVNCFGSRVALLSFITDKSNENVAALKTAKANLEITKQELKDYKDKAARILQVNDPAGNGIILIFCSVIHNCIYAYILYHFNT